MTKDQQTLLNILPRGEPQAKEDRLLTRDICRRLGMKPRGLRLMVTHLRRVEHVPVGSFPRKGYWLAVTTEEKKRVIKYLKGLGTEHFRTAWAIETAFENQPSQGGFQLGFEGKMRKLTEEQAIEANDLYWTRDSKLSFKSVSAVVGVTEYGLKKIWNNLKLHKRKRGGWGKEDAERKRRENADKIKANFADLRAKEDQDE